MLIGFVGAHQLFRDFSDELFGCVLFLYGATAQFNQTKARIGILCFFGNYIQIVGKRKTSDKLSPA